VAADLGERDAAHPKMVRPALNAIAGRGLGARIRP
jgi:hypothetical protein